MIATVADAAAGGARVTVRGRAKGSFLTTKWGEDLHANGVEKDLRTAVDDALAQAPRTLGAAEGRRRAQAGAGVVERASRTAASHRSSGSEPRRAAVIPASSRAG